MHVLPHGLPPSPYPGATSPRPYKTTPPSPHPPPSHNKCPHQHPPPHCQLVSTSCPSNRFPRAYRYSPQADVPHAIVKGHQQGQLVNPSSIPMRTWVSRVVLIYCI